MSCPDESAIGILKKEGVLVEGGNKVAEDETIILWDDSTQNRDDGEAAKEKEGFPQSRDDPNKEVDFLVIHQDFSFVQWTECVFGREVLPPPKRGKN